MNTLKKMKAEFVGVGVGSLLALSITQDLLAALSGFVICFGFLFMIRKCYEF